MSQVQSSRLQEHEPCAPPSAIKADAAPAKPRQRYLQRRARVISALIFTFVLFGAFGSIKVFHAQIMMSSGVLLAMDPWTHTLVACSLKGCYAIPAL